MRCDEFPALHRDGSDAGFDLGIERIKFGLIGGFPPRVIICALGINLRQGRGNRRGVAFHIADILPRMRIKSAMAVIIFGLDRVDPF